MNIHPVSLLYTANSVLLCRLSGFLHSLSEIRQISDPAGVEMILRQRHDTLVFVDLQAPEGGHLIAEVRKNFPESILIALGDARSDPGLKAAAAGVYAVEAADADRLRIQSLFAQAKTCLRLRQENRTLRETILRPVSPPPCREHIQPSLYHFSGALRRFDNIGMMLENIVEGVACCARVSRVAIFSAGPDEIYRFRAGMKCVDEIRSLEFCKSHPVVQWMQLRAYSISRPVLQHADSIEERILLEETLDKTGSDAILPLFGRERLIGWLCLGRSLSGLPFGQKDIEELSLLAGQVSVAIENSLLHDGLAIQKALAENLLQAMPAGIVAVSPDGSIRWFNSGAESLLHLSATVLTGRPAEQLPGPLSSLLRRCMAGEAAAGPVEWVEPESRKSISIQIRPLRQHGQCMGALAVLNDLTEERILRERQNNLERGVFWNQMASAISHELRNPLVAISTFAQLLPERFHDEEFRSSFMNLSAQEIRRLNGMIDQLETFARPPELRFRTTEAGQILHLALQRAESNSIRVAMDPLPSLRPLACDEDLLADAVFFILQNAADAVRDMEHPQIRLSVCEVDLGTGRSAVQFEVCDNGPGIPGELHEDVFSPFFTTKARGVGLGLPIVRRTMIDHGGRVSIESQPGYTAVRLTMPVFCDPAAARDGGIPGGPLFRPGQ